MQKIKIQNIPQHVALIMDGNRRWARSKGRSIFLGHEKGEDRIEPIVDCAIELGISYLTFWAFSTENWNRDKREVEFLLSLFRNNLNKKIDSFHKKNVRIHILGDLTRFPKDLQEKTKEWMEKTKNNTKIVVNIALNYGGRDEILSAVNKVLNNKKPASPAGRQITNNMKITKEDLEKNLDTVGIPDPDLLIRTGGEKRLSGFLLWQMEYAEFYFTEKYWPDFTSSEFVKAIQDYSERIRRFGK